MLKCNVKALSHQGFRSDKNEDALFIGKDKRVFAIADGMGGEADGDRASYLALAAVEYMWTKHKPDLDNREDVEMWLDDAVDTAHNDIFKENSETGLSMGTTILLCVFATDGNLYYAHAGDSRLYSSRLGRLTFDHASTPWTLTRALGSGISVTAEHNYVKILPGDLFLLCTDGLTKVLPDRDILELLAQPRDMGAICEELLTLTLEGGGPDNVTLIAVSFSEDS